MGQNTLDRNRSIALAELLKTSLELDLKDLEALEQLLQHERSSLEKSIFTELEAIANKKMTASNELDRRAKHRIAQLNSSGLNASSGKDWLQTIELLEKQSGIQLWALWRSVESALKQCDRLLKINEKIVSTMHQSANNFLTALEEDAGSVKVNTYSAVGEKSRSGATGRTPIASI